MPKIFLQECLIRSDLPESASQSVHSSGSRDVADTILAVFSRYIELRAPPKSNSVRYTTTFRPHNFLIHF